MIGVGGREAARKFDKTAIENGVSSLILMENAAFSLYLQAISLIEQHGCDRIIAFAGRGGNGGDAMAVMRILHDRGCPLPLTLVPLFDDSEKLTGDTLVNWNILPVGIEVGEDDLSGNPLVIDGIMGTGLSRNLSDDFLAIIQRINYATPIVLAIDIPTGLDSNSGQPLPEAIYATTTVSMGILKKGLFFAEGPNYAGKIVLGNISAPTESCKHAEYEVIEESDIVIPSLSLTSYKTKNGHALFIMGDAEKMGAIVIAARAFLHAGGGLATIAVASNEHLIQFAGRWPDLMLTTDKNAINNREKWDVIVVGPGLSHLRTESFEILRTSNAKIVCDAGVFDLLHDNKFVDMLAEKTVVFTPHPGELFRTVQQQKGESWESCVIRFPLEENHFLLAKNSASMVRDNDNHFIIPHGALALSFGGTGDLLCGICAAFLHILPPIDAAITAAMVHRKAGLLLEQTEGRYFHNIETLLSLLGEAMSEFV